MLPGAHGPSEPPEITASSDSESSNVSEDEEDEPTGDGVCTCVSAHADPLVRSGRVTLPDPEKIEVPFGTLGLGYTVVEDVKPLLSGVHLTPVQHPGAGREGQVIRKDLLFEQHAAVKQEGGRAAASTLLQEQQSQPQYMVIGSDVDENRLPHAAGPGAAVEAAAISNRHFARKPNKYGGLTGVVQEHARPAIMHCAEVVSKFLKDAGRVSKGFQEFPPGYEANSQDAATSLHVKTTLLR